MHFVKIGIVIIDLHELECAYMSGSTLYIKVKSSQELLHITGVKNEEFEQLYKEIEDSQKPAGGYG
jgi:hypothetical protein